MVMASLILPSTLHALVNDQYQPRIGFGVEVSWSVAVVLAAVRDGQLVTLQQIDPNGSVDPFPGGWEGVNAPFLVARKFSSACLRAAAQPFVRLTAGMALAFMAQALPRRHSAAISMSLNHTSQSWPA